MPIDDAGAPDPAGPPASQPVGAHASDTTTQNPAADLDDAAAPGRPGPSRPGALRRAWPWLRWPVYGFAALLALLVGVVGWLWFSTDLPATPSVAASAVLLDHEGNELAVLAQEGLRLEVPLEEMAPVAIDALVAAEDRRFYGHRGIDPTGIARAFWRNLTDDGMQGGSTITQQLVKNTYLTHDRTLSRKVREAVLALKLERTEDKDAILERYLNTVYFGRGAYGLEAAARNWFGTSAGELSAPQAALLAGILRAPEALDPTEELEAATRRRDAVLDAMASMGALSAEEAEAAKATPIEVIDEQPRTTILRAGVAPHFVEHVRRMLIDEFGEQALYDRGLVVHTTLDIDDQRAAEAAVAAHLDDPEDPQAAVVAVDRWGAVRAWVGGRDFDALKVDLVSGAGSAGRQPGSTFKPITLAAYLEDGGSAAERFRAPSEITLDAGGPEPWEVSNAGGSSYGTLSLAEATVNSVNTVYAQAVLDVGPEKVVDMANRLGIERELQPHASIALGAQEVTPLELATVYSTLGRSGARVDPFVVTSVEDRHGEVVWEADVEPEQVVDAAVADTVNAILEDTPRSGTARRAALDRPMAAKTGTTQDNADAWLAGYTPEYTTIVWVGNPDSNEPIPPVDGVSVQGGTVPAMIWHDFMVEAVADVPETPFPEPDDELLEGRGKDRDDRDTDVRSAPETTQAPSSTTSSSTSSTTTTSEPDAEEGGDGSGESSTTTTTTAAPATTTTTAPPTTTTAAPPTTAAGDSTATATGGDTTQSTG
ncbi:MAG TPA: PBP1A family penicillin-binding protein [Acidimicrobiales bacterium]|nr:PBP1A family penicillin-binding protein [Acidimicrobiales bacterium]